MLAFAILFALSSLAASDDETPEWGGFRGNNGAGLATSEALPDVLAVEETALWRTEVPAGYSSPTVAGSRVFLTAAEGTQLLTLCLDRYSGEIRWTRELEFDGQRTGMNSPAAPSPVTDGERVYALFHNFGLVAYDLKGEQVWSVPMEPFNIPHGMSTSPVLHAGLLVLQVDQDLGAYLLALDTETGEERWKVERPGVTHSYSTPAIYAPEEGSPQVVVSGSYQIAGYDLETGDKLWWVNGSAWQTKAVPVIAGDVCYVNAYMVPSSEFGMPKFNASWEEVLAERDADGDGKIARSEYEHEMLGQAWFIFDLDGDDLLDERDWEYLVSSGHATGGLFAIRLDGRGDVTETHLMWKFGDRRGLPDIPSPLVLGDTLFMIKEGGLLTAVDLATGEVVKQGRVGQPDQYSASPVGAAGRIITASGSGQLAVLTGSRDWEVVSVSNLDEEIWATPAIADGQVFVRSQSAIYCFQSLED